MVIPEINSRNVNKIIYIKPLTIKDKFPKREVIKRKIKAAKAYIGNIQR